MFSGFFARRKIDKLDLASVQAKLQAKKGWSEERVRKAEREYRRFLILIASNRSDAIVPWPSEDGSDDLDQFWHQHILDTKKYYADCRNIFGDFIHHDPHISNDPQRHRKAAQKTRQKYRREFGEDFSVDLGDGDSLFAEPDAPACDASHNSEQHSHGHTHGGHDTSHSHHCGSDGGGHSCGGHGCGGGH